VLADGKKKTRQITYGRSQTTEQGNLKKLLQQYIRNSGAFSAQVVPYVERLGKVPLADDGPFKNLLIQAAREDPIMRITQDEFFDAEYYARALRFFEQNQFMLPLSLLKKWSLSYVDIRHQWLKHHANALLRKTIYRTQCFKDQIAADNWLLDKLPVMANGVAVR
jgi:chitosanase